MSLGQAKHTREQKYEFQSRKLMRKLENTVLFSEHRAAVNDSRLGLAAFQAGMSSRPRRASDSERSRSQCRSHRSPSNGRRSNRHNRCSNSHYSGRHNIMSSRGVSIAARRCITRARSAAGSLSLRKEVGIALAPAKQQRRSTPLPPRPSKKRKIQELFPVGRRGWKSSEESA